MKQLALTLTLIAGVVALPAQAQFNLERAASDTAPCLDTHFDPDRYRADLIALGWLAVSDADRASAVHHLADAIAPALDFDLDWTTPKAATLREANRIEIANHMAERQMFFAREDGDLLLLTGLSNEAGERQIQCWRASSGETILDTIALFAEGEQPTAFPGGIHLVSVVPQDSPEGQDIRIVFLSTQPHDVIDPPLVLNEAVMMTSIWTPEVTQ